MFPEYYEQVKFVLQRGLDVLLESIAYVPHGVDKRVTSILDLAPQSPDVHIYSSVSTVIIPPPDLSKQGLTSENLSFVACQELK